MAAKANLIMTNDIQVTFLCICLNLFSTRPLAIAKAIWKVVSVNVTGVVGFVNILDVYEYLGAAEITIQYQFGFQYMKDFMGFNTIFLLSEKEIPRGTVIATPVENIVLYTFPALAFAGVMVTLVSPLLLPAAEFTVRVPSV